MGNRGVIHNGAKEIIRQYKVKAWITCQLEFKDRQLPLMEPNHYTQLFFRDEVTAFSAGHRPCALCRREDFNRFKEFWIKGNAQYKFDQSTSIRDIDEVIHNDRLSANGIKILFESQLEVLPNGAFILYNEEPYLLWDDKLYKWSTEGYSLLPAPASGSVVKVITPKSIINTFMAGYVPQVTLAF